jgi:hypothetical protein
MQDHLALQAAREPKRPAVVGHEGTPRKEAVEGEKRPLDTIFAGVDVERFAYRAPRKGAGNLMPLDLELNLCPRRSSRLGCGVGRRWRLPGPRSRVRAKQSNSRPVL